MNYSSNSFTSCPYLTLFNVASPLNNLTLCLFSKGQTNPNLHQRTQTSTNRLFLTTFCTNLHKPFQTGNRPSGAIVCLPCTQKTYDMTTARHTGNCRLAHHKCNVLICPCRIDLSLTLSAGISFTGIATSINFFACIIL